MIKRGLSSVVSSMLLVILVLVSIGIVSVIISSVISYNSEEITLSGVTIKLSIQEVKVINENVSVSVKREAGSGNLSGIRFILNNKSVSELFEEKTSMEELEERTFVFSPLTLDSDSLTEVSIAPILKSPSGKDVPMGIVDTFKINKNLFCQDSDWDGYGNPGKPSCSKGASLDCDDNNGSINPGALEICDGVDNNCNGQIDEGFSLSTYYQDLDLDSYGNPSVNVSACASPSGYVSNKNDCNDNDASINPGALEICGNNLDDNCDGNNPTCLQFIKSMPGIVSWWKFEGNTNDEMNYANGIANGNPVYVQGKFGQALKFDGVDDWVNTTKKTFGLINNQNGTILVWVKQEGPPKSGSFVFSLPPIICDESGRFGIFIGNYIGYGDKIWCYNFDSTGAKTIGGSYMNNAWQNLIWMHNSTTLSFYSNGISSNSILSGNTQSESIVKIGVRTSNYFNGTIDELIVFNRALSPSEIQTIYNSNLSN